MRRFAHNQPRTRWSTRRARSGPMIVSQVRYEDGLHDRGCAARAAAQLGQDLPPRSPPRSPGSQPSPPPADPAQPRRNDRKTQETTPTAATDGPAPCPGHEPIDTNRSQRRTDHTATPRESSRLGTHGSPQASTTSQPRDTNKAGRRVDAPGRTSGAVLYSPGSGAVGLVDSPCSAVSEQHAIENAS